MKCGGRGRTGWAGGRAGGRTSVPSGQADRRTSKRGRARWADEWTGADSERTGRRADGGADRWTGWRRGRLADGQTGADGGGRISEG